jgi:CheY-like chemotaxis protein
MDIHMPVMDGLEASTKINAFGIRIPIVAVTANIMSNDIDMYKMNGIKDFLGKPFTSQELWRCLLKYFTPASFTKIDGSRYAADNEKLQKYLKINFVKENKNKFEEFTQALNANDIKFAHRIVHSLKTVAGQIGEEQLQNTAHTAEELLSKWQNMLTEEHINNLKKDLDAVLEKLAPLAAEEEEREKEKHEKLDAERTKELVEKLEAMLLGRNPQCIQLIDEIRAIPGTERLIQQIEDYEFKTALTVLSGLKESLNL